jgi:hypothetical protein
MSVGFAPLPKSTIFQLLLHLEEDFFSENLSTDQYKVDANMGSAKMILTHSLNT